MTESLYKSLMPMLAVSNGDLWLLSKPHAINYEKRIRRGKSHTWVE